MANSYGYSAGFTPASLLALTSLKEVKAPSGRRYDDLN